MYAVIFNGKGSGFHLKDIAMAVGLGFLDDIDRLLASCVRWKCMVI